MVSGQVPCQRRKVAAGGERRRKDPVGILRLENALERALNDVERVLTGQALARRKADETSAIGMNRVSEELKISPLIHGAETA